jgi:Lrp/AsnC family transcriptional regulator for asnA, asnC and gidA
MKVVHMNDVDEKDMKILDFLKENARIPFTKIAADLGVSEATVRKHIKSLEENGVILKYTVEIDPTKIGYKSVAQIGIDTLPERYLDVVKRLTDLPEVHSVFTTSGDHMIMIEFWARDSSDLMDFSQKLQELDGVTRICPAIIMETVKR